MKNLLLKIAAVATGVLAVLVWSAALSLAQAYLPVQDCCQQALRYKADLDKMTGKYSQAVTLLNETRKAGDALQGQKDKRIKGLTDQANEKLTDANNREKAIATAKGQSDSRLDLVKSELQTELVRSRFLGWGRKRWVNQLLKQLK